MYYEGLTENMQIYKFKESVVFPNAEIKYPKWTQVLIGHQTDLQTKYILTNYFAAITK